MTRRIDARSAPDLVVVDDGGSVTQIDGLERDRSVRRERPGVAWRSTIIFDHPGCWRVNMTRGTEQRGDVWIDVA